MICDRCLLRASRSLTRVSIHDAPRAFTASMIPRQSLIARRFASTDSSSQPTTTSTTSSDTTSPKSAIALSSVPAGTPLKGINYLKSASDPLALADDAYPPWLWTLLSSTNASTLADPASEIDPTMPRKQKKKLLKKIAKERAAGKEEATVPVYEQTVDLPEGDGSVEAGERARKEREGLRRALRGKNRAGIKEANYLKTMR
ncbi:hypothetical protein P152DRAFT_478533 [Eremomyces bilateralis CBS 781.70]|uniref:Large ribosomal subunit protein mL54 n=1 Tax=Eremomyces bilateralis CBS 781.70 TaxID=1392243 RepID=A0A6G1GHX8_9PEZI|nr:uncharacterized protein P152DRAFT_478533 [Eremomyces bilateralis CBS 781.70]KAF1817582.1 hypothetical protein P152DRAFT_478533 [Eremomyces bilateralis CBS 781.70]